MNKHKQTYSFNNDYNLEEVYSKPYEDTNEERLRAKRDKHICRMRLKTIISGEMLESESYPLWDTKSSMNRAPKQKKSRDAQHNLNNKNAVKAVVRLINANFTTADMWATFTYDDLHLPADVKAANAEVWRYIRRIKRECDKRGLPPLKYIVVTEFNDGKGDMDKIRVHHHIVMNFPDRDVAEAIWRGGSYTKSQRLQINEFGFEGLARYITKDPRGKRRYSASRNLKKPTVIISDYRMTRGKADKIVRGKADAKDTYEKIYKGYVFTDLKAFTSDYVSGNYLYVRMRRQN